MADPRDGAEELRPNEARGYATLRELVDSVSVLVLVCAPAGLDVAAREAAIYDPVAPPTLHEGAVVLAVGVRAKSHDAAELVKVAGAARAAAVAMKLHGERPDPLRKTAEQAGVALLCVPDEMTWSQAYTLVRTA